VSECIKSSNSDLNKPRTWYGKIHLCNNSTKIYLYFTILNRLHHFICTQNWQIWFYVVLFFLLPEDDPLWPAARRSIKCYTVMSICMELVCVFYLLSVANPLSIIHEMNNTKFTLVMSIRPSVRICQPGCHWTDCRDISIGILYENMCRTSKVG